MQEPYSCLLKKRAILSIEGPDASSFLQGLISNDILQVSETNSIFAALLSPQGKYQFDFFIAKSDDRFYLDCEMSRIKELIQRLKMFKLRSNVVITDLSLKYEIQVLWGPMAIKKFELKPIPGLTKSAKNQMIMVDPRLAEAGIRVISKIGNIDYVNTANTNFENYDKHRLKMGLTDGMRDLLIDKSILLEANFDELNGIDWKKGCYIGQEITARSKYRGLVKRRFIPVSFETKSAVPGSTIIAKDKKVGTLHSMANKVAMADILVKNILNKDHFSLEDNSPVYPIIPKWMKL